MKILLFGRLAEGVGRALELDFPGGPTIAAVRLELARRHPELAGELAASRVRACVNDIVAAEDRVVDSADEVAFLPPLSGG